MTRLVRRHQLTTTYRLRMATMDKVLQRPLYVFDLPEKLLYTLQLKIQTTDAPEIDNNAPQASPVENEGTSKTATSCTLCSLSFANLQDQKSHVRSDLHAYNTKQRLRGKPAVSEDDFERLIEQLDESLSGSDSSSSDDDGTQSVDTTKSKDSTLSALLKRQARVKDGDAEDAPVSKRRVGAGTAPMIWFSSSKIPSNTSLGVYRTVFSTGELAAAEGLVNILQRKQLSPKPNAPLKQSKLAEDAEEGGVPLPASMQPKFVSTSGPHYFLCMIGGGHFAAMLVSLTPKLTKKAGINDRTATVIAHKTFHRYTTRRKQGGSQSANDGAKGAAHSAGASIRRYNEDALVTEVRALLKEWKSMIDSSELVFVRASGQGSRTTLFGPYEEQVLTHKDDRLRGFPFNTRRATQAELMRAFVELTRVKVNVVDEAALARQAQEDARIATAKGEALANGKANSAATKAASKLSKADEEALLHTTQLQALIRRSKAPALLSYLQTNSLSADMNFFPAEQNHHAPTPLHLAAASNSAVCVTALLVKSGANPELRNEEGKPAFEIAGDRPTRDAFRLARSALGESRWGWDAAGVPAGISQDEADARTAREKDEKAAEEKVVKDRKRLEADRLRQEDAAKMEGVKEKKFGQGHLMGGKRVTAEERRAQEARGMTDEMRMRLEREKRARAAEERMKRLQGH